MSDDINSIRERLKGKYASQKWIERVNNMPDSQVVAIFKRLQRQHKV